MRTVMCYKRLCMCTEFCAKVEMFQYDLLTCSSFFSHFESGFVVFSLLLLLLSIPSIVFTVPAQYWPRFTLPCPAPIKTVYLQVFVLGRQWSWGFLLQNSTLKKGKYQWGGLQNLWYYYDWKVRDRMKRGICVWPLHGGYNTLEAVRKSLGFICATWSISD